MNYVKGVRKETIGHSVGMEMCPAMTRKCEVIQNYHVRDTSEELCAVVCSCVQLCVHRVQCRTSNHRQELGKFVIRGDANDTYPSYKVQQ